jgi:hypothetical protein
MSVQFADTILSVAVVGATVRIELGVRGKKGRDAPETLESAGTLVMPVDGFANSFMPLKEMIEKLEKDGVIKPRQAGGAAPKKSSPNFQ